MAGGPKLIQEGELSVYLTDPRHFGASLLYATGSEQHLRELAEVAKSQGMTLSAEGLRRGRKLVASKSEEAIYDALGLQYIEPELREGAGEVGLARERHLPELVRAENIRGILHAHTNASDGVATLEEMAEATRSRGYAYLGVTDHSRSAQDRKSVV